MPIRELAKTYERCVKKLLDRPCACSEEGFRLYSLTFREVEFSEIAAFGREGKGCERIFMRRCIKVPAPKVRDRGERALCPGRVPQEQAS